MARCSATLVESACCFAWVGSASRDVEVPTVLADSFGFRVARTALGVSDLHDWGMAGSKCVRFSISVFKADLNA